MIKPFSLASLMRLPFSWSVTAMMCFCPILANLRFERFGHNQILAHRLRRSAGFADDAEARFIQFDNVHQRGHALRIDIILNIEFRAGALAVRAVRCNAGD